MKNEFCIENVRCEVMSGGPFMSEVVAEIEYSVDGKKYWLYNAEADGIPMICVSKGNMWDCFSEDRNDDEFGGKINEIRVNEFYGIDVDCMDYEELFENIYESADENVASLLKLLIYVTTSSFDDMNDAINDSKGKLISRIDIPLSEPEIDYLYEKETGN